MWLAEKGGEVYIHPYDLGAFDNLTSVSSYNLIWAVSLLMIQVHKIPSCI